MKTGSQFEMVFPALLKRYRESTGLTRQSLSSIVGLDGSYIHRLEMGNRRPSRRTVISMARALKLDEDTLNKWLVAAGYGPHLFSGDREHNESASGRQEGFRVKGVTWTRGGSKNWLEAVGLESSALNRLMQAFEVASSKDRKTLSSFLADALRLVTESLETSVHVAVVPAAGGSHRLLAPHVTQRLLIKTIREAVECGILEIVLVIAPEMEEVLYVPIQEAVEASGRGLVKLERCVQPRPAGLGDAILRAEEFVRQRTFTVLLPDDVLMSHEHKKGKQLQLMIDALKNLQNANIIAVTPIARRKMSNYGVVELDDGPVVSSTRPIRRLVEKPEQTDSILQSPNILSIVGRYVLQPDIFDALRRVRQPGARLELTTALQRLRAFKAELRAFPLRVPRTDFGEVLERAGGLMEY